MDTRGSLEEVDGDFEFSQTLTSVSITELDRDKDELFAFFTKSKRLLEKEKKSLAHFAVIKFVNYFLPGLCHYFVKDLLALVHTF